MPSNGASGTNHQPCGALCANESVDAVQSPPKLGSCLWGEHWSVDGSQIDAYQLT